MNIKTGIINNCRSRQKTCLGYKWEYKKRDKIEDRDEVNNKDRVG